MDDTAQRGEFAARLRDLRARSGLTLRELQAVTFASDSALSRYLTGRAVPPWTVVATLCEQVGVDAGELRPSWQRARAGRRTRVAPPPLAELSAVEAHLISISDEVMVAIEETRARGDQVPRHLLAVQRSGADAVVRLRAARRLISPS
ncbi:helix-turn-helix domain-containing protein [Actinoplanes sp. NPDC051343]|uniref:helix-turn-helix domain-containing protein n=1 Tax=Actinoplanes sp. NPDC051343 TaxID=3363906 RepID=UPI00379E715C